MKLTSVNLDIQKGLFVSNDVAKPSHKLRVRRKRIIFPLACWDQNLPANCIGPAENWLDACRFCECVYPQAYVRRSYNPS